MASQASQTFNTYIYINFVEAVKMALDKFPRIRNPIVRARLRARPLQPIIYYRKSLAYENPDQKVQRVRRELIDAGITPYGLLKSESRYLPRILHDNEQIEAIIYGQHESSSAMMVATDERIIYLDKKPMVEMFDEVSYEVVSGIEFDIHTFFATIVLHTPVKNYEFKLVNLRCAERFARHIERHRLEREPKTHEPVIGLPATPTQALDMAPASHELNDMAGYYWLPTDEEERRKVQLIKGRRIHEKS